MSKNTNTYVYTLYRNSDDRLLVFDGSWADCARKMHCTRQWFFKLMMLGGSNSKWTIIRRKKNEEEGDEDDDNE